MALKNSELSLFIMITIAAIVGIVFLGQIADDVTAVRRTQGVVNNTVTIAAVNSSTELTGRSFIGGTGKIHNVTSGAVISANNLTLETITGTNGLRTVALTTPDKSDWEGETSVNVSYEYQPDGYLPDASSRGVINLVILFGSLVVLVTVIAFLFKGQLGKIVLGRRY